MATQKPRLTKPVPGSVLLVDLGDAPFGHEQSGLWPAIVLSLQNGVIVIIPLTTNTTALRFSATYAIANDNQNGLSTPSVALVFQIRAVDAERMVKHIGVVSAKDARALNKIIRTISQL